MPNHEVIGYLEVFNESIVQGWTIDPFSEFPYVELVVGEEKYSLPISWEKRSDVAERYGSTHIDTGFFCKVPNAVSYELLKAYRDGKESKVFSGGFPLSGQEFSVSNASILSDLESLKSIESEGYSAAEIEKVDRFLIKGWAVSTENLPVSTEEIQIFQNGKKIEAKVVAFSNQRLSESLQLPELNFGFDIFIPGYVWDETDAEEACYLDIYIKSQKIQEEPLKLSREMTRQWLIGLSAIDEATAIQSPVICLAIEHLRFGSFSQTLPLRAIQVFARYIEKLSIDTFLSTVDLFEDNPAFQTNTPEVSEGSATLLLWEAMRELNRQITLLPSREKNLCDLVVENLRRFKLIGESREWYLFLATQLTCESGNFKQLYGEIELTDFKKYADLNAGNNCERMTISLPLLVVERRMKWAISLVRKIGNRVFDGWLHTECIRFALQEVHFLYFAGEIETHELESYHLAFFDLLKNFKADWFSRLHGRILSRFRCLDTYGAFSI